jgi:hypothetical protein
MLPPSAKFLPSIFVFFVDLRDLRASQAKVKPDSDVRDVVLNKLTVRRWPVIQLQHEGNGATWMTIGSHAQSLYAHPRADGA